MSYVGYFEEEIGQTEGAEDEESGGVAQQPRAAF